MCRLAQPANAELVVEGVIKPNSVKTEGPFGEFPGYYGRPEAGCPLVEITRVHYRTHPILTNAIMADYPSNEQSGFFGVIRLMVTQTQRLGPVVSLLIGMAEVERTD